MTGTVIIIFMIGSSALCAYIAGIKNRDGITWAFIGFLTGLFGVVAICAVSDLPPQQDAKKDEGLNEEDLKRDFSILDFERRLEEVKKKHKM